MKSPVSREDSSASGSGILVRGITEMGTRVSGFDARTRGVFWDGRSEMPSPLLLIDYEVSPKG